MPNNDMNDDVAKQMSDKTKGMAKGGANKAARKVQKAGSEAAKKFAKKAVKAAVKVAAKAVVAIIKIIIKILIIIGPYLLAALALLLLIIFIASHFTDDEYESKSSQDNYQTEDIAQDNDMTLNTVTGNYDISQRSAGNKLVKMFYGFNAQKGYWKIVVDKDGKPKGKMVRGDDKDAQKIVDKYNREKEFMVSSDLLYLLDVELNAGIKNEFFFPEQFTQPVYHDEELNLKMLTDEDGELVVKSTKYNDKGKSTKDKEVGVWDYGFGSILQYQEFTEKREKRAELATTHEWDYDKKKLVEVKVSDGTDDTVTEDVAGYPKDTHMITKVTFPVGTIKQDVEVEWVETAEPFTKKVDIKVDAEEKVEYYEDVHQKNKDGEKLYWAKNPKKTDDEDNWTSTEKTKWKYKKSVKKHMWIPTTLETTKTYKGKVWEQIPVYVNDDADTSGIIGDKYIFDYLSNYTSYVPTSVMENFDVENRTGKDIEGLEEIFAVQDATEGATSEYDNPVDTDKPANIGGNNNESFKNAMKHIEDFERYGKRYGVDPYILVAIAAQESSGNHEAHKGGKYGYGLMQIESPGEVITSATAFNFETGKEEKMIINDRNAVDSVEDNIRAGAMLFSNRIKAAKYNIRIAIQQYNFGPSIKYPLERYSERTGKSMDEIYANQADDGWIEDVEYFHNNPHEYIKWSQKTYGDAGYLNKILGYYSNPNSPAPYGLDESGTKYSMDGTVQTGATIVGNGTSTNQNWFTGIIDALAGSWDELFDDSPTNALLNKKSYTFVKHNNKIKESDYDDFIKLYWTFMNNIYFSEVKDEITLDDWKEKFGRLFENPAKDVPVNQELIAAYEELSKYFPDGIGLPADKASDIATAYDGTRIELDLGENTAIKAIADGEILRISTADGTIEVKHSGDVVSTYTGLKEISVKKGDKVKQGDKIGKSKGNIGLGITNKDGDSIDPTPLFDMMGSGNQDFNYGVILEAFESVAGTPYKMVPEARDPSFGFFDCSGVTQWAYGKAGKKLPRTAQEQFNAVQKIEKSQARPGDLIFFEGTSTHTVNPITHVGMYIGNGKFWNAQVTGGVKIADANGYWSKFKQYYGRVK